LVQRYVHLLTFYRSDCYSSLNYTPPRGRGACCVGQDCFFYGKKVYGPRALLEL
jgi:hypothetical protein